MGRSMKRQKALKNTQIETLELKTTRNELKSAVENVNVKLNQVGEN